MVVSIKKYNLRFISYDSNLCYNTCAICHSYRSKEIQNINCLNDRCWVTVPQLLLSSPPRQPELPAPTFSHSPPDTAFSLEIQTPSVHTARVQYTHYSWETAFILEAHGPVWVESMKWSRNGGNSGHHLRLGRGGLRVQQTSNGYLNSPSVRKINTKPINKISGYYILIKWVVPEGGSFRILMFSL